AEAAYFDDSIARLRKLPKSLEHVSADARRALDHAVLFEGVDHGDRGCARYWISAEGAAVTAGRKARRDLFARDHRADRKSAAERLGQRHDIRLDAGVLEREKLSGASHAGLHFVQDQQQLVAVAPIAHSLQVVR